MQYTDLSIEERDRLRAAFDAGFAAGSCAPSLYPAELIALMDAVQEDWFTSLETRQAAQQACSSFPEIDWLRAEQARASVERQLALGDAQPPDSWVRRTAQEGKP